MVVIAMDGAAGSGARALGPLVAQRLGADYVDRLILASVARHVGATVEALHQREERPPTRGERLSRLLQRILERSAVTGAGGDPYFGPGVAAFLTEEYEALPQATIVRGHELDDERYIEGIRKALRELAGAGNVVIVGRGGPVILRDLPGVLRVGVVAKLEDRIATIMARERVSREEAAKTVAAREKAGAYFFKRFFRLSEPYDPEFYHLTVNLSDVSLEYATDLVDQTYTALAEGRLRKKVGAIV